jgi:hypothetical protein
MSLTLDQILLLAGRLDDSRDFDAPRERFRRFLRSSVRDLSLARRLVEEGRHGPDDQHRRAFEDLVVHLGRFLGFEVDFALGASIGGRLVYHGAWHSPAALRVVVAATSPLADSATTADTLAQAVQALTETTGGAGGLSVGLLIVTPLSVARPTGEPARAAVASGSLRVLPLAEIHLLADLVAGGRLAHQDVARMLASGIPVDFVAGLLGRAPAAAAESAEETPAPARRGTGFWLVGVHADHATSPEDLLELVIGKRHVFGVTDKGTVVGTVGVGDGICFHLPGKGVVGHARVVSVTDGAADLRDARRYRQVLRLEGLELHLGRPVRLDAETELRLRAAPTAANRQAQTLLEISAESYRTMSAPVPAPAADVPGPDPPAADKPEPAAPIEGGEERLSG